MSLNIKTGNTIFLESDGSILSDFVSIISKSKYTHVGIIYVYESLQYVVSSALFSRAEMIPLSEINRPYFILETHAMFDESSKIKLLTSVIKSNYGLLDAILLGIDCILKRFNFDVDIPNYEDEICTEFVQRCLGLPSKVITPDELLKLLKEKLK